VCPGPDWAQKRRHERSSCSCREASDANYSQSRSGQVLPTPQLEYIHLNIDRDEVKYKNRNYLRADSKWSPAPSPHLRKDWMDLLRHWIGLKGESCKIWQRPLNLQDPRHPPGRKPGRNVSPGGPGLERLPSVWHLPGGWRQPSGTGKPSQSSVRRKKSAKIQISGFPETIRPRRPDPEPARLPGAQICRSAAAARAKSRAVKPPASCVTRRSRTRL